MGKDRKKKRIYERILSVFAWLSLFLAVITATVAVFASLSSEKNGKEIFGHKLLIVESSSMSLSATSEDESIFFNEGDLIIIKVINESTDIKVGDVITFVSYNPESMGKTISHKVRSIKTSVSGKVLGYETYGINTGVSDSVLVEPSTILGVYANKVPNVGKVFRFLKTPAGFFLSISVPCLLLIIFFSIKVGKWLGKREVAKSYDAELEKLRGRLSDLENTGEGVVMQNNVQETSLTNQTQAQGAEQSNNTNQPTYAYAQGAVHMVPPFAQTPAYNDKAIELTLKSLGNTIEMLTHTIETLANTAEKPVESLTRTVETLVASIVKPNVVEKVVEKTVPQPIVQPVIIEKEKVVAPPVQSSPIEQVAQVVEEAKVAPVNAQEIVVTEMEDSNVQSEEQTGAFGISSLPQREKVPFNKKLLSLNGEVKSYFSDVHNELVSYKKVHHRISFKGITYRVGRTALAKMVVRGKTLKLHLALNVNDYPKTVYFQEDSSNVVAYKDVPFTVKVKSNRAKNNAVKLVNSLAEKNNLVKKEEFKGENVLNELKTFK